MEKKSEEKRVRIATKNIKEDYSCNCESTIITSEERRTENELEENRMIWGWQCIDDVAKDIWGSIHSSLLEGDLVFAYKSAKKSDALKQIVVVRNFDLINPGIPHYDEPVKAYKSYSVGYITSAYSALLPNVPFRFVACEVADYLKDWKIDKTIINTYEAIIEELSKEENRNGE